MTAPEFGGKKAVGRLWRRSGARHCTCIANTAFFLSVHFGETWCGLVEIMGGPVCPKPPLGAATRVADTKSLSNSRNKLLSILISKK